MLWRNHPGDDPDVQYLWWNTGSLVNFGKIDDPTAAGAARPGRAASRDAGQAQGDLPERQQGMFAKQLYNVSACYVDWIDRRAEERAGPRRPAAARRRRQARCSCTGATRCSASTSRSRPEATGSARPRVSAGARLLGGSEHAGDRAPAASSCSWCSCCRALHLRPAARSSRVTSPTPSCRSARRSRSSNSGTRTASTRRSSSSTSRGSATSAQGDLGKDYQSNTPVTDKLQTVAPGVAPARCSTRRSSRC